MSLSGRRQSQAPSAAAGRGAASSATAAALASRPTSARLIRVLIVITSQRSELPDVLAQQRQLRLRLAGERDRLLGDAEYGQHSIGRGQAQLDRVAPLLKLVAHASSDERGIRVLKAIRPGAGGHGELPLAGSRQITLDFGPTIDPDSQ